MTLDPDPEFPNRLARVRQRISSACQRAGRSAEEITLLGVTKGVNAAHIRQAMACGMAAFGENYLQEALPKLDAVDPGAEWHFIGRLQRNKARWVVERFAMVQTVDSERLAQTLDRLMAARQDASERLPVLIEVNLSGDPERPGAAPDAVLELAACVSALPRLDLRGLMGIPPPGADPEASRPHFRTLKRLSDALHNENTRILSMGMTADYEAAIEEGSTLVRVGTGLFGRRQ